MSQNEKTDDLQSIANLIRFFCGSLSNGVDDLENFTPEMEWSFFCSRRFLLCFFKMVQLRINTACVSAGVDSCMNSCR